MPVRSHTTPHSKKFFEGRELREKNKSITTKIKKVVIIPKYPKFDLHGDINLLRHDLRHVKEKYLGYPRPTEEEAKKRKFLESKSR